MTVRFNASLRAQLRQAAMRGVVRGTEEVRTEAVRLILETAKTGRIYTRGGISHQASAPGEPPATDTGTLVNSITTEYDESKLVGRVVAKAPYAPYLEFGTQTMEPRPFLRPALANTRKSVEAAIKDEISKVLKK